MQFFLFDNIHYVDITLNSKREKISLVVISPVLPGFVPFGPSMTAIQTLNQF